MKHIGKHERRYDYRLSWIGVFSAKKVGSILLMMIRDNGNGTNNIHKLTPALHYVDGGRL
jgi:hypothetical protein